MKRAPSFIPVAFDFTETAGRQSGWGRWNQLSSNGGLLMTRFPLSSGESVYLSFTLAGHFIDSLPARVDRASQDDDGWWLAEIRVSDVPARSDFGRLLREVLA